MCMVDEDPEVEFDETGAPMYPAEEDPDPHPLPPVVSHLIPEDELVIAPPVPHTADNDKDRLFAKSKYHLLTHTSSNLFCQGCSAKSRHEPHYQEAFKRDDHQGVVIVDKLTLSELNKYAIIFPKV